MTEWKAYLDAAMVDLQAARDGEPGRALGHLHDANVNLSEAIQALQAIEDDED